MRRAFACRKFFYRGLADETVKRADSLKRKKEFRYTYRLGKAQSGWLCTLVYAKNRTGKTKVGFSVSKKIGNAVTRNRVKRRMREAVTPLIPELKNGYNIIFIARSQLILAPYAEIGKGMAVLLARAGMIDRSQV